MKTLITLLLFSWTKYSFPGGHNTGVTSCRFKLCILSSSLEGNQIVNLIVMLAGVQYFIGAVPLSQGENVMFAEPLWPVASFHWEFLPPEWVCSVPGPCYQVTRARPLFLETRRHLNPSQGWSFRKSTWALIEDASLNHQSLSKADILIPI